IEADLNGGCAKTVYSWSAPTFTQGAEANGQIQRYARQADYTTPCGSPAVGLFDSDPSLGVSVEQQGSASVFAVDSANASTVTITLHLTEGAKLKPTAGSDTRANVPLKTTTSLRNY